jgi:hypothetical protein
VTRIPAAILALVLLAAPALADVTITSTMSGKGLGAMASGASTTHIKGAKMRTDTAVRGETVTTIIDAQAQQMITFSSRRKEAEVHDLARLSADLAKNISTEGMSVSLKPNGQTREILGRSTQGYDLSVAVPMKMGDMAMTVTLAGPVWIATDAPGTADYAAFYRMAAEKGLFFARPEEARAQPAQAKGMAEMYRAMTEIGGVPYATEIEMDIGGGQGMMAAMMKKMGGMVMTTTVTAISMDPIPDSTFAVPAGYTTRGR